MKDEYVIINKTAILKRIEELEKEVEFYNKVSALSINPNRIKAETKLSLLKQILSQSTPLIPEIEKAFDVGNKRGWSGYPDTDNWKQPTKQDYISNLKFHI